MRDVVVFKTVQKRRNASTRRPHRRQLNTILHFVMQIFSQAAKKVILREHTSKFKLIFQFLLFHHIRSIQQEKILLYYDPGSGKNSSISN